MCFSYPPRPYVSRKEACLRPRKEQKVLDGHYAGGVASPAIQKSKDAVRQDNLAGFQCSS